jgi:hypothetical protein
MTGTMTLKFAHCSMQFSDTPAQMRSDARKLFDRGYHILQGTEAGPNNPLAGFLRLEARDEYKFHVARETWIAVRRDLVQDDWHTGYIGSVESWEGKGKHADRGISYVGFHNDRLGDITTGCAHYLTKGRRPGDPNYRLNRRLARDIGEWADDAALGSDLCFYSGDQNIVDRDNDTFFEENLTSSWDELQKWENTGHGNIDVIASHDRDGRVKAVRAGVLSDGEFKLDTDHFLVETDFQVKLLK